MTEPQFGTLESERRRLEAIAATGLSGSGPEERFDRITRLAQQLLDVPMSYLNIVDDEALVVKSPQSVGEPAPRYPYGTAFCEYTVHGSGLFEVPDARADQRFAHTPAVTEFGVRFYAGVPLRVANGEAVGTLCVMHPEARTLTHDERERLTALGRWAEGELRDSGAGADAGAASDAASAALADAGPLPVDRLTLPDGDVAASALSLPFGAVSGDLHAWRETPGALTATVADVMGKGPVAGALAEELRASLYADPAASPLDAVAQAAARLDGRLGELGAFATLFHGRLDGATGVLDYVDAGHGLTLVVSASGESVRLASRDMPLGVQNPAQGFAPGRVQLRPGDTLLSVTDGALDLYDSTLEALLRIAEELRARTDVDGFLDGMAARVAVSQVDDDVTVLVVTFG